MKYPVNPFVDVEPVCSGVFAITSPGDCDSLCYLVEGQDKALLIDTGFGVGDLKGLCKQLTDKEILVVNTHFHFDHVMGNFQFEKVFIHKADAEALKATNAQYKAHPEYCIPESAAFTEKDFVPYSDYEIIPVEDNHVFDLGGGVEIELLWTPGHSDGNAMLLDRKRRMLFSGDALVRTPTLVFFGENSGLNTVEAFHESLVPLLSRIGEFDALYPGHFEHPQPTAILSDMVTLTGLILQQPDVYDEWQDMGGNPHAAWRRHHGLAYISFDRKHVYRAGD